MSPETATCIEQLLSEGVERWRKELGWVEPGEAIGQKEER